MDIQKRIDFINKELLQGRSLKAIAEQLKIGYSTIKSKLKDAGYKKVDGLYKLVDSTNKQDETTQPQATAIQYRKIQNNENKIQEESKEDISLPLLLEQVNELSKDVFRRLAIIEERVLQTNARNNNSIVVRLPDNIEKMMSSRVHKTTYDRWQEFCKNQNYLAKDLLSMALIEYMEKYE